jgi:hypothetical protein
MNMAGYSAEEVANNMMAACEQAIRPLGDEVWEPAT